MKAHISKEGILTITPESPTEVYALSEFKKKSMTGFGSDDLNEKSFYRESKIVIHDDVQHDPLRYQPHLYAKTGGDYADFLRAFVGVPAGRL